MGILDIFGRVYQAMGAVRASLCGATGNNGFVLFCREVHDIPVAENRVLSHPIPANLEDPTCWLGVVDFKSYGHGQFFLRFDSPNRAAFSSMHHFFTLLLFKSESYVVAKVG